MKHHMPISLASLTTGLLLASTAPVLAPPAAAVSDEARAYSRAAVVATNKVRDREERTILSGNACLQDYARRQARKMAHEQRIWHQDLQPVLRDCNKDYVGENIAAGYPTGTAVVNNGWMRSEGHRKNILQRQFRMVAVAARLGDDGRWYAAQVFGRSE